MYTLKLLLTSDGYRRVGLVALGLLAAWRFGYIDRRRWGDDFMAMEGWLDSSPYSSLRTVEGMFKYALMGVAEVALLAALAIIAIEIYRWVMRGFGDPLDAPEPSPEVMLKALRAIRAIVLTLITLPVLGVVLLLIIDSRLDGPLRLSDGDWAVIGIVGIIWLIGMVIVTFMDRFISPMKGNAKPQTHAEKRPSTVSAPADRPVGYYGWWRHRG